jgi:hypothetical protein
MIHNAFQMLSIAELPNKDLSYQSNDDTVRPSSEAEEEEDDEYADEEFDKLVSDAGDDLHIFRDCAVREAVTYVVVTWLIKSFNKVSLPTMRGAFRCLTSFQNDLLINLGKATNNFLKLDKMRNLISSSRGSNSRGGPTPLQCCFGKIT